MSNYAIMTIKEGESVQIGALTERRFDGSRDGYDVYMDALPDLEMRAWKCDPTDEELRYAELLDTANDLVDVLTAEETSIKKIVDTIERLTELI